MYNSSLISLILSFYRYIFSENSIVEDDLNRLVQIFNERRYTPAIAGSDSENENVPSMEEFERLHKMFKLATFALKVIKRMLLIINIIIPKKTLRYILFEFVFV